MDLKHRLQTALREDANVVGLAGSAALSLALLNPLPLLIGFVAETIYLLYVPDSRWYSTRLSRRYDADVRGRRQELRQKQFVSAPASVVEKWDLLESLRTEIGLHKTSDASNWLKFLRRIDYLMELQVQTNGTASLLAARVAPETTVDAGVAHQISESENRLTYYETTTKALYEIASEMPDESTKTGFRANIAQAERQKQESQCELFEIIAAQHLIESTEAIGDEVLTLLRTIRDAVDLGDLATWEADAQRLVQDSELSLRRLSNSLKPNH